MQNDLCLKIGDKVQFGTTDWYPVVGENPARYKGIGEYVIPPENVTNVRYLFRVGEWVDTGAVQRQVINQSDADNLSADTSGRFRRVDTPQFVLLNADIGTITAPVTIPDDIFHVEKRLKGGKRVFNDLTVTVTPIAGHAAVQVSFTQPVTPVYNVVTLREIASLLNEIADCL